MDPNYVNYGYTPVYTQLQGSQLSPDSQQFPHYQQQRLHNDDPSQTVPTMLNSSNEIQFKVEKPDQQQQQQQQQIYQNSPVQYQIEQYPYQQHSPDINYQQHSPDVAYQHQPGANYQNPQFLPSIFNPHQYQPMPMWHGNDNNYGYPQVVPQYPPMNYHQQAFMMRPPMGYQMGFMRPTKSSVQSFSPQISPVNAQPQPLKQEDGPFSCSTCQKNFLSSTNLKRHLTTKFHHNKVSKGSYDGNESMIVERGDQAFEVKFMEVQRQQSSTSVTDLSEAEVVLIDKIDAELSSIETTNFGIVKVESLTSSPLPIVSSTQPSSSPDTVDEFRCNICNKTFTKRCYFTQHNKTAHIGDKPFKCSKCGKKYQTVEAVEDHMMKHSGEKPFKCQMCTKSFNHKTDLKRHIILHTTEKPHVCQQCGKGFVRKDHLQKHLSSHQRKMEKLKKAYTQMKN